ncbi:MAG: DUF4397 domain-containing protein, partial [Flavobacteriales bacterium]
MRKIVLFSLFSVLASLPGFSQARLQVIHNSPDAPDVDIFANGDLFISDLAFREATAFVDVPAGVEIDLAIAPAAIG